MKKAAFFVLLQCSFLFCIAQLTGKVVSIADGDSFTLLAKGNKEVRIRLHGIDAPERSQPFSTAAKNYLSALIYGKQVEVEIKDVDRYGRIVGITIVEQVNVNEQLLKAGYAWHFKRYDNNIQWGKLESEARTNKRGVWSQSNPTPPWEWRRSK